MSGLVTGPVTTSPARLGGTSGPVDRADALDARLDDATGTATPVGTAAPAPATPVDPTIVVAPGDAAFGDAHAAGHDGSRAGRPNRGQLRSSLSHLANAVRQELLQLARDGELDEQAGLELRSLARSFKTTLRDAFRDAKDEVRRDEAVDPGATTEVIAGVRNAYDELRAAAAGVFTSGSGDTAVVDDPAAPADDAATGGTIAAPVQQVDVASPGAVASDPLATLDATFERFLGELTALLERLAVPDTDPGAVEREAYARLAGPGPEAGVDLDASA